MDSSASSPFLFVFFCFVFFLSSSCCQLSFSFFLSFPLSFSDMLFGVAFRGGGLALDEHFFVHGQLGFGFPAASDSRCPKITTNSKRSSHCCKGWAEMPSFSFSCSAFLPFLPSLFPFSLSVPSAPLLLVSLSFLSFSSFLSLSFFSGRLI